MTDQRREYERRWRAANRERVREVARRYRHERELSPVYRERRREYVHQWRAANREKVKATQLRAQRKYLYGLSLEEFVALLARQNNRCAICRSPEPGGRGGFNVDHDHRTGRVRGLLCGGCNMALGIFKDSTGLLKQAIQYLEGV